MLLHERRFRERPCCWPIVSRSTTLPTVAMAAAVPTFSWTYKAGQQQQEQPHPLCPPAHVCNCFQGHLDVRCTLLQRLKRFQLLNVKQTRSKREGALWLCVQSQLPPKGLSATLSQEHGKCWAEKRDWASWLWFTWIERAWKIKILFCSSVAWVSLLCWRLCRRERQWKTWESSAGGLIPAVRRGRRTVTAYMWQSQAGAECKEKALMQKAHSSLRLTKHLSTKRINGRSTNRVDSKSWKQSVRPRQTKNSIILLTWEYIPSAVSLCDSLQLCFPLSKE